MKARFSQRIYSVQSESGFPFWKIRSFKPPLKGRIFWPILKFDIGPVAPIECGRLPIAIQMWTQTPQEIPEFSGERFTFEFSIPEVFF